MVQSGRGTGVSVERGLSFKGNNLDTISTNHASFPGVADRDARARPESTPTWSCTDNPCTRWIRNSGCLSASHGLCVTLRVRNDAEGCAGSRKGARDRATASARRSRSRRAPTVRPSVASPPAHRRTAPTRPRSWTVVLVRFLRKIFSVKMALLPERKIHDKTEL